MRESEFDEIAGELYLVPPARFVATRNDLVRQARTHGETALADRLKGLRRPTSSAWLVNVLTRRDKHRMERLSELGRELRRAQTGLDATQLRRLSAQRAQLLADLVGRARRHAAEADLHPSDGIFAEVEATLHAALVDLGASAKVLSGRLVKPMSHSGFGPMPHVDVAPKRRAGPTPAAGHTPPEQPIELTTAPAAGRGRFRDGEHEWAYWPVDVGRDARGQSGGAETGTPAEIGFPADTGRREGAANAGPPRRPEPVAGALGNAATAEVRSLDEARRQRRAVAASPQPANEPADPGRTTTIQRAEAALAAAESAHWQREYELADAEAAVEAARDRLEYLDSQRMEARREKVSAEQRLAEARSAQRSAVRAVSEARRALDAAERSTGDAPPES